MRFISQTKDHKMRRGQPAKGDEAALYWVDTEGSWALIGGVLYQNGQPCGPGEYQLPTPGGNMRKFKVKTTSKQATEEVTVDVGGSADQGA